MKKFTFLSLLFVALGVSAQTYKEDFETLSKSSYASETVTLNGVEWNFTGSNTGNGTSDWKIGTKSARLAGTTKAESNSADSKIEMLANKQGGIGNITFQYCRYGSDAQIPWKVEWSADGTSWTSVGEITATATVQTFSYNLNKASARIRIIANGFATSSVNGKRINIDNLILTDNGTPSINVNISSFSFNSMVGTASAPQTLTVSAANLTSVPTVNIAGTDAAMFTYTGTLTTDGGELTIVFNPTSTGSKTATMTITSGSLSATVELVGTATDSSNPYNLDDSAPVNTLRESFGDGSVTANTLPAGWSNVSVQGEDKKWMVKRYSNNNYAEMTAHNGTGQYQTLLISPAINFDAIDKTTVKFSWNSGYTKPGTTLKVFVMSKDGTKTEVKSIDDNSNPSAYGAAFNLETLNLSAYTGVKFLAFEYNGTAGSTTTSYQVDDVEISPSTSLFATKFDTLSTWVSNGKINFNASAGERVEVYNVMGQKALSVLTVDGQNEITVPFKGVAVVKVGNRVGKVIL